MNLNHKKILHYILNFIIVSILVFLDQFSKYLAVLKLKAQPDFILIENVLELHYLENKGAAFGMLQNQKFLFILITVAIIAVIVYVVAKLPEKGYLLFEITVLFILSGAIGNLIDRIRLDYVVDFIYFKLIDFPIFNMADIYVSVFSFVLIVLLVFVYKENDFDFLKLKHSHK